MRERAPRLIVQGGPEKGKEIPLTQDLLAMGRSVENDIVIDDRLASRHHAQLEREHDQYVITDRGSRNGTFVNSQRIAERYVLRDGDEIQIGLEYKALYIDPEATGALVSEALVPGRGLWVDRETREVWVRGKKLTPPVSKAQLRLLTLLQERPGRVYSRDEIVEAVWPGDAEGAVSDETIDALAGRLRRRIAAADAEHRYIVTVRGHGFKFIQPWEK
jgi:pSer/pThr/pTyr-binding forkhead associated (FHA) protein